MSGSGLAVGNSMQETYSHRSVLLLSCPPSVSMKRGGYASKVGHGTCTAVLLSLAPATHPCRPFFRCHTRAARLHTLAPTNDGIESDEEEGVSPLLRTVVDILKLRQGESEQEQAPADEKQQARIVSFGGKNHGFGGRLQVLGVKSAPKLAFSILRDGLLRHWYTCVLGIIERFCRKPRRLYFDQLRRKSVAEKASTHVWFATGRPSSVPKHTCLYLPACVTSLDYFR